MSKWAIPPKGGHMDLADGIYFQNMTWEQVKKRLEKNDLIIIPVGSTEQHGPGAPTGEDTFLVTRMAELVAEKTGCTVAQPIWYGSHPYHHLGMPGTIVVPEDIFVGLLRAVMAGLWNAGFRKMILLNGHGQEYVIPTAIHQFAKRFQVPGVFINLNWYHPIPNFVKDKEHGGPMETVFMHGDETETSYSLALFPEMIDMGVAIDTKLEGYLPEGHIDTAGNVYQRPIAWYGHVGGGGIEVSMYPEGVIGSTTLANVDKAKPGLEALLDYMERLIGDILAKFPPGVLPPIEEMSQRKREDIEAVIKGPFKRGGRHLYTIAYPP